MRPKIAIGEPSMQKRDLGIIFEKPHVVAVDLKTKRRIHKIGPVGAELSETDGKVVIIAHPHKRACCYDLRHKTLLGHVGRKSVSSLSAVNGQLVIGYHRGPIDLIDLEAAYPAVYARNIQEKIHALMMAERGFNKCQSSE